MKQQLLLINHVLYLFGTSIYVGLLWSLRFIFRPSWEKLTPELIPDHFMIPVNSATAFFTIVVPIMLLNGLVLVISEWKHGQRYLALASYGALLTMMAVGGYLIRPVNEAIDKGVSNIEQLRGLLQDWMLWNDVRMVIMTVMWGIIVCYFIHRNNNKQ